MAEKAVEAEPELVCPWAREAHILTPQHWMSPYRGCYKEQCPKWETDIRIKRGGYCTRTQR